MIFCPDGIIPDSGFTRPNNTHTRVCVCCYGLSLYTKIITGGDPTMILKANQTHF